jgi:hypothetical protein
LTFRMTHQNKINSLHNDLLQIFKFILERIIKRGFKYRMTL